MTTLSEVRVVNQETGGEKGMKGLQMSYLPIEELREVLRLYDFGASKYQKHNWKKGYDWSLSYDALQRHAMQFWDGESKDEETGCDHLASVIFHAFALMFFDRNHPKLDDRPAPFSGTKVGLFDAIQEEYLLQPTGEL